MAPPKTRSGQEIAMFYVYVLYCRDTRLYIGYSSDLRQRLGRHENGHVPATKGRLPVKLIFYEAHANKYDALRREKYFKTSKGKNTLRTVLRESLASR